MSIVLKMLENQPKISYEFAPSKYCFFLSQIIKRLSCFTYFSFFL